MRQHILVLIAVLVAWQGSATAQSGQDLEIARQAAKSFDATYSKTGMTGVNVEVDTCYDRARNTRSEQLGARCIILDFLASEMDAAFFRMIGRSQPDDSRNGVGAMNS